MMALFGQSSGAGAALRSEHPESERARCILTRPSLAHHCLTREELLWRAGDVLRLGRLRKTEAAHRRARIRWPRRRRRRSRSGRPQDRGQACCWFPTDPHDPAGPPHAVVRPDHDGDRHHRFRRGSGQRHGAAVEGTLRSAPGHPHGCVASLVRRTVERASARCRCARRCGSRTSPPNCWKTWCDSPSVLEIAVCDRKNEILVDSDPKRLGEKFPGVSGFRARS